MKSLYAKTQKCPLCLHEFFTMKVKKSKMRPLKIDSDFCPHHEGDNPIFYYVNVCPDCGYSYTESFSKPKADLKKSLPLLSSDFSGERDEKLAIEAYGRSIKCAQLLDEKSLVMAGLYLHLSWVFRIGNHQNKELEMMVKALDYYKEAFWHSTSGNYDKILYLLGELNRRLGNLNDAVFYFQKLINDRSINNPELIRRAREMWQYARDN